MCIICILNRLTHIKRNIHVNRSVWNMWHVYWDLPKLPKMLQFLVNVVLKTLNWKIGMLSSNVLPEPKAVNCCNITVKQQTIWNQNWHLSRPLLLNMWVSKYLITKIKEYWFNNNILFSIIYADIHQRKSRFGIEWFAISYMPSSTSATSTRMQSWLRCIQQLRNVFRSYGCRCICVLLTQIILKHQQNHKMYKNAY